MTTGIDPDEVRRHLEAALLVDTVRITRPTGTGTGWNAGLLAHPRPLGVGDQH
ncbi:hypothetical protein ABT246_33720 [Streptomyces sp. NPDC001553]|uniref:hypothetical protein n=1 Tax=Streptomyces sp. NPDC001553 TaxID=3154385 RepID=UPI00331F540C